MSLYTPRKHEGRLRSNGWQDEQRQEYVRGPDHDQAMAERDATIARQAGEIERLTTALSEAAYSAKLLAEASYPAWRGRVAKIASDAEAALRPVAAGEDGNG